MSRVQPFEYLKVHVNARSRSGLLRLGTNPGEVFHFKRLEADPEALETEAAELLRAAEATRSVEGIRPVRLEAYLKDDGLLITEYVPGAITLFNHLFNRTRWFAPRGLRSPSASEIGARIGRWLRAYHGSTLEDASGGLDALQRAARLAARKLEALAACASRLLEPGLVERLEAYLKDAPSRLASHQAARKACTIHADMDPANIIVASDGTLYVLDLADSAPGIPWQDVVRAWHGLWGLGELSARRRRILAPCREALLAEYGEPPGAPDDPLFLFLRCWNAVTTLLVVAQGFPHQGLFGARISRRLSDINLAWLESVDW